MEGPARSEKTHTHRALAYQCREDDTGGMTVESRVGALALFLFSAPFAVHADVSSLVWGGAPDGPAQIVMVEGGTYEVPLNTSAPAYVTGPDKTPDEEWVFWLFGDLYKITGSGREYVQKLEWHNFDDPDNPNDGDPPLAWTSAGSYELDLFSFPPPQPFFLFENHFINWLAKLVLGETAYAQFGEPIFLGTIHFTIEDVADSVPDPVVIIPGILGSAQHNGVWLIDPITHAYDNLIDTLAANGYERGITLFSFPYEWRQSNRTTAVLLDAKIDEIKTTCGCDKVDIVAHSMGGLVARQYIQSDAYDHDVDQLIFLGTPHLGAPKAYLMWEGGEEDVDREGQLLKFFLKIEAGKHGFTSLFDYIRAVPIPSVQELLPVYGYIKHAGSSDVPSFPNSEWYPNNLFLSDLNNNIIDLYNSGVTITNFVGQTADDNTITTIRVIPPPVISPTALWGFGIPDGFFNSAGDHGLERGAGDGTVPLPSAALVISNLQIIDSEHTEFPTKTEGAVFKTLTDRDPTSLVNNSHGWFETAKNVLIFQILSPADFVVVAPNGLKVGKDFVTGEEFDQVPDAFYSGFGTEEEYVTIPNPLDGEYKIITQGTGAGGTYTIAVGVIGEATSGETFFTGQTLPNLITELNVDVNSDQPEQTTITPADQTPPLITISAPLSADYVHSAKLPVNVSATDSESGVYKLETFLDDTPVANVGSVDLFFKSLDIHTLLASSTDNVGNAATSTRTFRVIATIDSTLSDIERVYKLGWINKKVYRNIKDDFKDAIETKKGKRVVDKGDLKDILEDMRDYRGKGLSEQGYRILKADFEWLINH